MGNSKAQLAIDAARDSLAAFCRFTYRRFQQPKHISYIIEHLEALERGECDRILLSLPPRHGKSWLCSWFFPAWFLGRHPEQSVIHVSYGQALANDFGLKIRNTLADSRYGRIFPRAELRTDSHAVQRFSMSAGGNYYGLGYGGPVTGRGCELLIIDDAVKSMAEATSEAKRQTLRSYYESTLVTRLEPGARVVVIGTRWHENDLLGWLERESEDKWTVIKLPAVAEPGDPLGRREGAALWPERFNASELAKKRRQVGSAAWLAEFQQRPAAIEGGIFKRSWWASYDSSPEKFRDIVFSLDTAFKTDRRNDYSVMLVLGITRENNYFVLDMVRGRYELPDLIRKAEALAERWPTVDRVLIEDKASGQSLIQVLRRSTGNHFSVIPIAVDGDKDARAISATPVVESGRVFLPKAARWLNDFLDELSSFPNAPHDDIVDALSQAINHLEQNAGFNFLGTGYPNGLAEELINYRGILRESGGHYGVAAMSLGITALEFQRKLEAQDGETDDVVQHYLEERAHWDRVMGNRGGVLSFPGSAAPSPGGPMASSSLGGQRSTGGVPGGVPFVVARRS
jgi:predicted phage terminase large subunit-like protein